MIHVDDMEEAGLFLYYNIGLASPSFIIIIKKHVKPGCYFILTTVFGCSSYTWTSTIEIKCSFIVHICKLYVLTFNVTREKALRTRVLHGPKTKTWT